MNRRTYGGEARVPIWIWLTLWFWASVCCLCDCCNHTKSGFPQFRKNLSTCIIYSIAIVSKYMLMYNNQLTVVNHGRHTKAADNLKNQNPEFLVNHEAWNVVKVWTVKLVEKAWISNWTLCQLEFCLKLKWFQRISNLYKRSLDFKLNSVSVKIPFKTKIIS